jgi:hypothetical protein
MKTTKRPKLMNIKETVTLRFKKETKRRIVRAVASVTPKLNMSEYVEKAVEAQLARDAAPGAVDFKKRFARRPKGPPVGDQLVRLILSEREES